METISEKLRAAIASDGRSITELAAAARIDHGQLGRFARGERDLTLRSADKLCAALGLRLTRAARRSR